MKMSQLKKLLAGKNAPIFTPEGYFFRYHQILQEKMELGVFRQSKQGASKPDVCTHRDIWQLLENELLENHKVSMYSTYNAFRSSKSRYLNEIYTSSRKKPEYEK
jgi:hypothetical protein